MDMFVAIEEVISMARKWQNLHKKMVKDKEDVVVVKEEVIEVVVISEAPTTKKTSKDLKTKLKGRTRGTMIGPNIYRDE